MKSASDAPLLALDTASPVVSLAIGDGEGILAQRRLELRRSAEHLLAAVDEALAEAGLSLEDLRGVAVLRGPGSFTGLRVGLGTVLGWHQALRLPVTGLDAHEVLATAAAARWGAGAVGRTVTAAVDAQRGEWCVRSFRIGDGGVPIALDERRLAAAAALAAEGRPVIGFGTEALTEQGADELEILPVPPLAAAALVVAERAPWDPGTLVQPIYFREPAVTHSTRDPAPLATP